MCGGVVIYREDELIEVPRTKLFGAGTRPVEVGDHIETTRGWGKVIKINLGLPRSDASRGVIVALAKKGPEIPPQEFPEWDMWRRAEKLLARNRATGRHDR